MKTILKISAVAGLLFLANCGGSTAENRTNKNSVNTGGQTNTANANTNTEKPAEKSFELPKPRPIENGKPQSLPGITVTVPADWKKIDGKEGWIKFQSPEKIELIIQRMYDLQMRDMNAEFIKLREENPDYKAMMPMIDGELGILYLAEKNSVMNGDILSWTTFPPPDVRGYSVKRMVTLVCPPGTYEQHKQIMFDVLYSTKLQR